LGAVRIGLLDLDWVGKWQLKGFGGGAGDSEGAGGMMRMGLREQLVASLCSVN
jgi:hypothetical protein